MVADFYQKITEMQGTVEDVARKIPGFGGYLEKQDRRAADALLRTHLVRVFEEDLRAFTRLQQQLLDVSGMVHMGRTQEIDAALRTFIDRIATAARGYGGIFDAIKVDGPALARIYAFDNALLAYHDQFEAGLSALERSVGTEEVAAVLRQLENVVYEANGAFRARTDAITGLQASQ